MISHTHKQRVERARLARIHRLPGWTPWHNVHFEDLHYYSPLSPGMPGFNPFTMAHCYIGNIIPLLEGATIIKYSEDDRDADERDDCGPAIVLTLKKKGVKYRIRISTYAYAAVTGFGEDLPALRHVDRHFTGAFALPSYRISGRLSSILGQIWQNAGDDK